MLITMHATKNSCGEERQSNVCDVATAGMQGSDTGFRSSEPGSSGILVSQAASSSAAVLEELAVLCQILQLAHIFLKFSCCGPVSERGGQGSEELLQKSSRAEVPVSALESLC
jgi:hypothetical protein